jgi:pimeloyl-ACP methyl ester carboxylesterase
MELQQHCVKVGEWSINLMVGGEGAPILFLHGIGLTWKWWKPVLGWFAERHTVAAIDLPGFGRSSPMYGRPRPEQYADLVESVIATLGMGPTVVVGHSLGGYVAVNAAFEGARGLRAVALLAPAGFGPVKNRLLRALSVPHVGEALSLAGASGARTLINSMVWKPRAISEEMAGWIEVGEAVQDQFLMQLRMGLHLGRTRQEFMLDQEHPLPVPAWLGWGLHDTVFPIETGYDAARVLGLERISVFRNSGHMPQIEEPCRFREEVGAFIETLPHWRPTGCGTTAALGSTILRPVRRVR